MPRSNRFSRGLYSALLVGALSLFPVAASALTAHAQSEPDAPEIDLPKEYKEAFERNVPYFIFNALQKKRDFGTAPAERAFLLRAAKERPLGILASIRLLLPEARTGLREIASDPETIRQAIHATKGSEALVGNALAGQAYAGEREEAMSMLLLHPDVNKLLPELLQYPMGYDDLVQFTSPGAQTKACLKDPVVRKALFRAMGTADRSPVFLVRQVMRPNGLTPSKEELEILVSSIAQNNPGRFLQQARTNPERLSVSAGLLANLQPIAQKSLNEKLSNPLLSKEDKEPQALAFAALVNALHERPDSERFAMVKQLSTSSLVHLVSLAQAEVFTSTFRGIANELLGRMKTEGLTLPDLIKTPDDKQAVQNLFLTAVNYGREADFLKMFADQESRNIFMDGLIDRIDEEAHPKENRSGKLVETAASLHDCLARLQDQGLRDRMEARILANYEQAPSGIGKDAYGFVLGAYQTSHPERINQGPLAGHNFADRYPVPPMGALEEKDVFQNGVAAERLFFYDDEDGAASFQHFVASYKNDKGPVKWGLQDKGSFVVLSGENKGRKIVMVANKPDQIEKAANDISAFQKQEGLAFRIIIHRGHSYHAGETIAETPKDAALVCDMGCGGKWRLGEFLDKASHAQTLGTTGEATKYVNDPLLKAINEELLAQGRIDWKPFWERTMGGIKDARAANYFDPTQALSANFQNALNKASRTFHIPDPSRPDARVNAEHGPAPSS